MNRFHLEELLTRSALLYTRLVDKIIRAGEKKLDTSENLARVNKISLNTVKKVCSRLSSEGYIQQKKKAGTTIVAHYSEDQVEIYLSSRDRIIQILNDLKVAGFNDSGIIACTVSAMDEYRSEPLRIIYTDSDFHSLFVGKKELEIILGVKVLSIFVDELMEKVRAGIMEPGLIVTSFRTLPLLEQLPGHTRVIPLKTTPPLEQLLNFSSIPSDARITMIVISDEVKERISRIYADLIHAFPFFNICTQSQVRSNLSLVYDTEILLTLKIIYMENEKLLHHIPRIITYNRFHDGEGIRMVRQFFSGDIRN